MSDLVSRIRDVFSQPQLSNFATIAEDGKPWVRYVMVSADENLVLRVATFRGSRKVKHIAENPEVHLTVGAASLAEASRYLHIQATASVRTDSEERELVWNDNLKAYFSGPHDPNFAVVVMKPYRIEYQAMGSMTPEIWEG